MKNSFYLFLLLSLFTSQCLLAQSSRNGYYFSVKDTFKILYVFAEAYDDSIPFSSSTWADGKMPDDPGGYLDASLDPQNLNGYLTEYFYQASFGKYILLGDYVDSLVQLPLSSGISDVIQYLDDSIGSNDLITARGYSINSNDFDLWKDYSIGQPKTRQANAKIDLMMVLWRQNSDLSLKNGGYVATGSINNNLKQKIGFDGYSEFIDHGANYYPLMRHEFAHALVGGNNFHTQGGYGTRKVMVLPGGYGIMSSSDRISLSWNAYDRWRLGWKPDNHQYYISGRDVNYNELNTDLELDSFVTADTIILRDFVTYGDAIRIKLPYLKVDTHFIKNQFIWLENRQLLEGNHDHRDIAKKGIYAFMQLGKNDTSKFTEENNYIYLIQAFGNYDMEYEGDTMIINTEKANPLTGYHMALQPADNFDDSDLIIKGGERIKPSGLKIDGQLISQDSFSYLSYPILGSTMDGFVIGDEIGVDDNPSASPILTYETFQNGPPQPNEQNFDNRTIHLNGLSIELLEEVPNANGDGNDIKVVIKWNDFNIEKNVRWCGPIHLHDSLTVKAGKEIILDQGLTPTKPVNPIVSMGKKFLPILR